MSIIAINSGSSSLKATVFQIKNEECTRDLDFHFKQLNSKNAHVKIHSLDGQKEISFQTDFALPDALAFIFQVLRKDQPKIFSSLKGVGHRFVHGGNHYRESVLIDQTVMQRLSELSEWAPLHNAFCYEGIKSVYHELGDEIPQAVVFDTSFYHRLPPVAVHYAIPRALASKHSIKRYGFHGISHEYLWHRYFETQQKSKIITMHLGSGCSMTATKNGQPLDTSMGFSPLEGLIMGTRSGDIDPTAIEFICQNEKLTFEQAIHLLNFESGLLGLCGISDMGELCKRVDSDQHALFAFEMFCYRILKYLGAYVSVLNGIDAFVFSGGIGENSPEVRAKVLNQAQLLKVNLDQKMNDSAVDLSFGEVKKISSLHSALDVFVIATDENVFIAKEALRFFLAY